MVAPVRRPVVGGCSSMLVQGKECGCCQPVKISELGIDTNACANVTFLSEQIGAKLSLSFGGKVLFEKTVSVKNPDPVCVKFHGKFGAEICGELYKLSVSTEEFDACARLEGKILDKTVATVDLGCFKMPFKKTNQDQVKSDEVAWSHLSEGRSLVGAPPCSCQGKECGCCQPVKIPELGIDTNACANVTFLSEQIGAKLSLSFGGKVLFEKTVSVKNPDPVCVKFHGKFGAEICGELYKLSVSTEEFDACARLEGKILDKTVATVDLGCFKMPFKKTNQDQVKGKEVAWSHLSEGRSLVGAPPCSCQGKECGCCQPVKIPKLGIDTNACANVTFLSEQIGAKLSLSFGGKVLFEKTVSVKNPDPVCVKFHGKFGAEICGELYKLSVSTEEFDACARLEGKILDKTVATVDLGCFKMPFKKTNQDQVKSKEVAWSHLSEGRSLVGAPPCSCQGKECGCCQPVKIPELGIDTNACANVTFLSEQIGAKLSLSFGGKVLFEKTVSVKNPDPVCVKFHGKFGAEICGELYKLSVSTEEFDACARLEGKILDKTVATVDLGCFKMPFKKTNQDQVKSKEVAWSHLSEGRSLVGAPPCSCQGKECGCCQPVKIPELGIDTNACANVTFLSEQIGAKLSLSFGGKVLFEKTVSVKNPDPVCVKFHGKFGAEICGELYKLSVSPEEFDACARLEGKILDKTVATVDLGCFKMPFKKTNQESLLESQGISEWLDLAPSGGVNGPCACSQDQCECCQHIKIKELKIDDTVCIQVQFLSTAVGVSLTLTIDGKVIFRKTLSLKDPPPICVSLAGGKLCIALYDLAVTPEAVSGCGRLEAKFFGVTVAKVKLGCFKIPLHQALYARTPEGLLYLGDVTETLTGPLMMGGELSAENFPLTIVLESYSSGRDEEK
ncbi:uncharacterized protein LOC119741641 [Patiria miniata]|uniref:DUF4773 domain-containing protein n=1 Tax=Patiria miniata TaxID=46514 RepID=A0A914BBK2_PATMI|nr:uncharacterized protein LOC119741641 [Patiria miniata]